MGSLVVLCMWEVIKNQGWLGGMAKEGSKAELGVPGSTPGGCFSRLGRGALQAFLVEQVFMGFICKTMRVPCEVLLFSLALGWDC